MQIIQLISNKRAAQALFCDQSHGHAKKRDRSEFSQAISKPTKRFKTSLDQFSSDPSYRDLSILDSEPLPHSEYSVYNIDATKQSLIERLHFDKIDERLTGLTGAQQGTCCWFLTKPEHVSWQDAAQQSDHSSFLWIRGNPGTGKPTLMKFLFEKAKFNARGNPSQMALLFFFLVRGTAKEKSTTGLYRSLLHQLFEKAADLKESLE